MKKYMIVSIILMTLSFSAQARQYIQCAEYDSWIRVVINLDGENSTLFQTNGVHLPDEVRVLKKLKFREQTAQHHIYETNEGRVKEFVKVPNDVIDRSVSGFEVIISRDNGSSSYEKTMSCFSSNYN